MTKLIETLQLLYSSDELRIRQLQLDCMVTVASLDGITDDDKVANTVVAPLVALAKCATIDSISQSIATTMVVAVVNNSEAMLSKFVEGHTLVFVEGTDNLCVAVDTRKHQGRGVSEPPTSLVLRGPREGFTEDIKVNMTLLRKRLKTPKFRTVNLQLGKYTNTAISVCYIAGVADKSLVDKIVQRIQSISIDGVLDSNYISAYLDQDKKLLFSRVGSTEKPDIATAKLLEGRVAIVVDGSPMVLTLPYMFIEDLQSAGDYHTNGAVASVSRVLRFISVIVSLLLPAVYVTLQAYNYQIIPLKFLITVLNATEAIPFSPLTEMLVVIVIFDVLREANLRMPTAVGMSLSLVGAIVLGDAAVKAGLLGAPAVMVGALSGIGLFAMPENTLVLSIMRFAFTFVGGMMGLYGIVLSLLVVIGYMVSADQYGTPFLAPYAPSIEGDKQDGVLRVNIADMHNRPDSVTNVNSNRRGDEK